MIPKKLKVGYRTYDIHLDQAHIDHEAILLGSAKGLFGLTDEDTHRIDLNPSTVPERLREILLHEALHTLTQITGLRMRILTKNEELGLDREEELCARLAPALLALLRDNPTFVNYLLEK